MSARQKFATQIDEKLLEQLRALAQKDGRHIQAIVEDALRAHMSTRAPIAPRPEVMAAYAQTHDRFAKVYEWLAK